MLQDYSVQPKELFERRIALIVICQCAVAWRVVAP